MRIDRPKSIQTVILLTLISSLFSFGFQTWKLSISSKLLNFENIFGLVFPIFVMLFLLIMIAKRKKWAWISFCILLIVSLVATPSSKLLTDTLSGVLNKNFLSAAINATLILIDGYCLYLLLKPESRLWFNRQTLTS